jgi:hypothetical protein
VSTQVVGRKLMNSLITKDLAGHFLEPIMEPVGRTTSSVPSSGLGVGRCC